MKVTTFLMFAGRAEEAMNAYVALFRDARVISIERFAEGEAGKAGTVKRAVMRLGGTDYMCFDSPVQHAFTFTPAISLFVDFDSREHLDRVYAALSDGGKVLMPPATYGFSTWFAWIEDRFGVSWQLNLP